MNKLIELLNEYALEDFNWCEIDGKIFDKSYEFGDTPVNFEMGVYVISKQFGFIKWLIDNDKIDRDKELKENGLFRKYFYDLEYVKNYDRLVMWLSVEDEPIEFLISILK